MTRRIEDLSGQAVWIPACCFSVAAVHEVRLDTGAFHLLVKLLGTKFPCKSGLGKALEC